MDDAEDKLKVEEDLAIMEDENDEVGSTDKPVEPEEGHLFKERYTLHEELGKGRYGVVRRVLEKKSDKSFAAKFVRTVKASDRQKVREEMRIMNMLRHPKLLRLTAAFENPKEIIMVTEYISGGELFERVVADDFTLTEKDSILFMRQICEGVRYMHENSVVHLDLKPENIMCHTRTSHRIKLIDFGLAQILSPNKPIRVLFGTPEFLPPEIINYEPIGTESDMWSVGVICYVLLTGLSPFMGDNDAETFANIVRADYDFEDEAFDTISPDAKDFISNLLQKKKELRMSAKQCLSHSWLAQHTENMSRVALPTDKLKKFIVRRKWQKTGNALRALGRMAMLSANRRSPSLSPTSTRSLGDVSRSESLESEAGQEDGHESSEHTEDEPVFSTGPGSSLVESVVQEEPDDQIEISSKERERADSEKDVCEETVEASRVEEQHEEGGFESPAQETEVVSEEKCRNDGEEIAEVTYIREKLDSLCELDEDTSVEEKSVEPEVVDDLLRPAQELLQAELMKTLDDGREEEKREDQDCGLVEENKGNGDDERDSSKTMEEDVDFKREADRKPDNFKLETNCYTNDNNFNSKILSNNGFFYGTVKSFPCKPVDNGHSESEKFNGKETPKEPATFKVNKDVAFERELTRRSYRKFNVPFEANQGESSRLDGSPIRSRPYLPTGNVSRTARLFEKLETEQSSGHGYQHQHHSSDNGNSSSSSSSSSTTKDAAPSVKARSERIQRAFAFWNK